MLQHNWLKLVGGVISGFSVDTRLEVNITGTCRVMWQQILGKYSVIFGVGKVENITITCIQLNWLARSRWYQRKYV